MRGGLRMRRLELVARFFLLSLFAFGVGFAAMLDAWTPIPLWTLGAFGVVWCAFLAPIAWQSYRSARGRSLFISLFFVCLGLVWLLPLCPCEPLMGALERVKLGMTKNEVRAIMRPYSLHEW